MRYSSPPPWLASVLVLLALAPFLRAEKLVLARSTASNEYLLNRMVDGKRQPQSYVFMAGRYYAGNTRDKSLERVSFRTIAERLALDLRQQDFHPAPALTNADLLLVVHWGVTAGRNRDSIALAQSMEALANMSIEAELAQDRLNEANAQGNFMGAQRERGILGNLEIETASETQTMLRNQPGDVGDSAMLLGLSEALRKEDKTLFDYERRKTLFEMTQEECYFVIVMAYDARTLISAKRLKRAWTLRVSINSAGVNFPEALDRIGHIASRYSGTELVGVTFDYPADRKRHERVELGELIILGTVDP